MNGWTVMFMGAILKRVNIGSVSLIPLFREKINYCLYLLLQQEQVILKWTVFQLSSPSFVLNCSLYTALAWKETKEPSFYFYIHWLEKAQVEHF